MKRLIFLLICCFFFLPSFCFACGPYTLPPPPDGWSFSVEGFDTVQQAHDYCSFHGGIQYECPIDYPFCTLNPGYYACLWTSMDEHVQYIGYSCLDGDSDGDGIPDDQDPCPQNPNPNCTDPDDGDGDGIPDSQDPCPQNPNPDCTDPDNPPPDIPPTDIPDNIPIGPCDVDITDLKAWLLGPDSFPFNFIYRIYVIFSPLFNKEPEAPVFSFDLGLDPSGKYSWIPDSVPLSVDFAFLDPIAVVVRQLEMIGLAFLFGLYGIRRYRDFTGA